MTPNVQWAKVQSCPNTNTLKAVERLLSASWKCRFNFPHFLSPITNHLALLIRSYEQEVSRSAKENPRCFEEILELFVCDEDRELNAAVFWRGSAGKINTNNTARYQEIQREFEMQQLSAKISFISSPSKTFECRPQGSWKVILVQQMQFGLQWSFFLREAYAKQPSSWRERWRA